MRRIYQSAGPPAISAPEPLWSYLVLLKQRPKAEANKWESKMGVPISVVDAFTDLVEELALAGPLVLGLDDLQWADPAC